MDGDGDGSKALLEGNGCHRGVDGEDGDAALDNLNTGDLNSATGSPVHQTRSRNSTTSKRSNVDMSGMKMFAAGYEDDLEVTDEVYSRLTFNNSGIR